MGRCRFTSSLTRTAGAVASCCPKRGSQPAKPIRGLSVAFAATATVSNWKQRQISVRPGIPHHRGWRSTFRNGTICRDDDAAGHTCLLQQAPQEIEKTMTGGKRTTYRAANDLLRHAALLRYFFAALNLQIADTRSAMELQRVRGR